MINIALGPQTSLYFLLYVSYATEEFSTDGLESLWKKSAQKNADLGLSGMLLYMNNRFVQVLEGEKEQVKETFDRIRLDTRHEKVMMVLDGYLDKRNFEHWSMGFHHIGDHSDIKYLLAGQHILDQVDQHEVSEKEHPVLTFLKMFCDKQRIKIKPGEVV